MASLFRRNITWSTDPSVATSFHQVEVQVGADVEAVGGVIGGEVDHQELGVALADKGESVLSVFDESNRSLTQVAEAKLDGSGHTVAVDQATHRVYFPLENDDGHPALRVMQPTGTSTEGP